DRAAARRIAGDLFREVHVATPAEICESRDPKGHYAKARAGALQNFTGIGTDYEPPLDAELVIDTATRGIADATDELEALLSKTGVLFDDIADLGANI
ncbi:adenylyl-sulfate kinase, partial [Bradyrhizobium sp.]